MHFRKSHTDSVIRRWKISWSSHGTSRITRRFICVFFWRGERSTHYVQEKRKQFFSLLFEKIHTVLKNFGLISDCREDRPRWVYQPLQQRQQTIPRNVSCHQRYARGHFWLHCRLPHGRWKELITNFESLTSAKQKHITCNSIHTALFARQCDRNI